MYSDADLARPQPGPAKNQFQIFILHYLVMGRLIGIGIEHLQNRAFDRESESHRKKLSLKFDSYTYFDSFSI